MLVLGGISMCVRSDKEPTPTKSSVSPTPQNANSQTSNPTSESNLPDQRYWPKQVRISAPIVLTGVVDGGTIRQTAKPGAVLDATLSPDQGSVILRRLDISGTLPIRDTDFMERARKAETEK
jgi:hypothetical protein